MLRLMNCSNQFVHGRRYWFFPPVKVRCISISGRRHVEGTFTEGLCLPHQINAQVCVFRGRPIGHRGQYYFRVAYSSGVFEHKARRMSSHLRVVK